MLLRPVVVAVYVLSLLLRTTVQYFIVGTHILVIQTQGDGPATMNSSCMPLVACVGILRGDVYPLIGLNSIAS